MVSNNNNIRNPALRHFTIGLRMLLFCLCFILHLVSHALIFAFVSMLHPSLFYSFWHCHPYILKMLLLLLFIGTPPRIDGRTIKYTFLEKQCGDNPPTPFSFLNLKKGLQV